MTKRCSQTRPARTKGADDAKRVAVQLYNGVPMRDTHQQHLDERDAPCVESVQPVTVAVEWERRARCRVWVAARLRSSRVGDREMDIVAAAVRDTSTAQARGASTKQSGACLPLL